MKTVDVVEVEGKGKFWKEPRKKPQLLDVVFDTNMEPNVYKPY